MAKKTARHGGKPAPYTKYNKTPYKYTMMYRKYPHLRPKAVSDE